MPALPRPRVCRPARAIPAGTNLRARRRRCSSAVGRGRWRPRARGKERSDSREVGVSYRYHLTAHLERLDSPHPIQRRGYRAGCNRRMACGAVSPASCLPVQPGMGVSGEGRPGGQRERKGGGQALRWAGPASLQRGLARTNSAHPPATPGRQPRPTESATRRARGCRNSEIRFLPTATPEIRGGQTVPHGRIRTSLPGGGRGCSLPRETNPLDGQQDDT